MSELDQVHTPLKTIELFAGVGGFRLGLEGYSGQTKRKDFEVVWSNQYEPRSKTQHASLIYEARFGSKGHSNEDVSAIDVSGIPDADVLVGGFPCQDYSVANSLRTAKGLIGQKGVLWWEIFRILEQKGKRRPKYLILENVDRLLKSPASQRGRDFAIMLASLGSLGYQIEWQVVNAADYGMPQRRRRVFILAYEARTRHAQLLQKASPLDWLNEKGVLARAFPGETDYSPSLLPLRLSDDLVELSNSFNANTNGSSQTTPFATSGLFVNGEVFSGKRYPSYDGPRTVLGDILEAEPVAPEFYIDDKDFEKWEYLKGAKNEKRTNKAGYSYHYTEGAINFPEPLDQPSRTIITSEGGAGPSRFKHVILTESGKFRRLTPLELERLNMFPDNFTEHPKVSNTKRAFLMGNALVVGIVEKIGKSLINLP